DRRRLPLLRVAPRPLRRVLLELRRAADRPRPADGGRSESVASQAMATWLPAYLLHGDDHDRVSERRARLKASAEAEVGPEGVEQLSGDAATPAAVGVALSAMTLGLGRRFVLVEGVE